MRKKTTSYGNQQPSLGSNPFEGSETTIGTPTQILGMVKAMVAGDGSLMRVKGRNNLQFQFKHAESQLRYLNCKRDLFIRSGLAGDRKFAPTRLADEAKTVWIKDHEAHSQASYRWRCMVSSEVFLDLFRRLYRKKNGKMLRVLEPELFAEFGWLGVAIYHQDQGSLGFVPSSSKNSTHVTPNIIWATCQEEKVNERIAEVIQDVYGIEFHSHLDKSGTYILRLQAKDINRFYSKIGKYVCPGMEYKFLKEEDRTSAELQSKELDEDIVRPCRKLHEEGIKSLSPIVSDEVTNVVNCQRGCFCTTYDSARKITKRHYEEIHIENGVNSGKTFQDIRSKSMKDNPDPSGERNLSEGATTR